MVLWLDFMEHLIGCGQPGLELLEMVITEFLHSAVGSPALRRSGNVILGFMYNGSAPEKLHDFYQIPVPYPQAEETKAFISFCQQDDRYARLDKDLDDNSFAKLEQGLPLKSVDRTMRLAKLNPEGLTKVFASRQKGEAVLQESEGTLEFEDTGDLDSLDDLIDMQNVKDYYRPIIKRVQKTGIAPTPQCLVGVPGCGKTAAARLIFKECGYQTFKTKQSKSSLVSESRNKQQKQLDMIWAASPGVGVLIDEIDKIFPQTQQGVADGGVSAEAAGMWQTFLSRDDLTKRGIFIISTTNVASALPGALQSRFSFVGVYPPRKSTLPDLIKQFITRAEAQLVKPDEAILRQAADILFEAGCGPREIKKVVERAIQVEGRPLLNNDIILDVARDFCGRIDPMGFQSAMYQSLYMATFRSQIPFFDGTYEVPDFLRDIIDVENKKIDYVLLKQKNGRGSLCQIIRPGLNQRPWAMV